VESIEVEVPTRGEVQAIHLETKARILNIMESQAELLSFRIRLRRAPALEIISKKIKSLDLEYNNVPRVEPFGHVGIQFRCIDCEIVAMRSAIVLMIQFF
jgi:hypothetical protein